jgi:hypothetical protein
MKESEYSYAVLILFFRDGIDVTKRKRLLSMQGFDLPEILIICL